MFDHGTAYRLKTPIGASGKHNPQGADLCRAEFQHDQAMRCIDIFLAAMFTVLGHHHDQLPQQRADFKYLAAPPEVFRSPVDANTDCACVPHSSF